MNEKEHSFAILIPAYSEDQVILEVASDALEQEYPAEKFDVIVISDSLLDSTVEKLKNLDIKVIEVNFEISTKSKALNEGFKYLDEDQYDLALVLDADNMMERTFLKKVNKYFTENRNVIQAHRIAKNENTPFAVLDAISEEINNNVFRKGHRNLGFPSALIGSAMIFRFKYFKHLMADVNTIGGFDKQLELKIIKNRDKIEYLEDAYVLDEKVQNSIAFSNQRKRWLSAQLYYFKKDFLISFWDFISKGNLDYFNKAFQFIQVPRVLLLGLLIIINIVSILFGFFLYKWWLPLLVLCIMGFIFSVPKRYYTTKTLYALLLFPKGFLLMLISLFNHKKAKSNFIHTKHTGGI
ncbi:MAG: glycosyltransferase [Bacteroidales bacterium]|nr:glycosyltransferase [Bacteroidales bacterium]MCF8336525.1 glycosyltransferase [Bacteroidales bacterium]